ncbi:DUF5659 domain-containing protein [Pseudomonadota bacterium]
MNKDKELYVSSDFDVACVLKYFAFEVEKTLKEDGKKVWCFKRSIQMDEVLKQYWKGELSVNIVNFLAVQRFMKSSLHN